MRRPTVASYDEGLWLHRQGRLSDAERIYRQILQREPANVAALHMLGLVALQTGQPERAVRLIGKAIALQPDNAEAHSNLGLTLQQLGRPKDALASYERAIAIKPDDAELHSNRGLALEELDRADEALASYDRAIALRPNFAEAHDNRGNALRRLKRLDEALAAHTKATALRPDFATAHYNNGIALRDLHRPTEALASFDKAIALRPDYTDAHSNRGAVLLELGRAEEALASCEKVLALQPRLAAAHLNRGNALLVLMRPDEALASFDRAVALMPGNPQAHNDRGLSLYMQGHLQEALPSFIKATSLRPDHAEAWTNQAICLLQMGRFAEGWPLYEWRKRRADAAADHRAYHQPLWLGDQDVAGKTMFIHWEQGLGDTILFCRYARLVAALGAKVVLEVQRPLVGLLAQLGPGIEVVGPGQVPAEFDCYCPLLSLPLAFGTQLGSIPSPEPYLRADEALRERWSARLPLTSGRRIGVAWSGSAAYAKDASRSIDFAAFAQLLTPDAGWVCLQKEVRPHDLAALRELRQVAYFGDEIGDFASTAALFDLMDLVIAVDTSVAHLAAAMGKPVWLLLSYCADWRWMLDRHDSVWYPSVRLFRQQKPGDWADVLDQVKRELPALPPGRV
jgi:tetratricopeptide (TPR) repeat protein